MTLRTALRDCLDCGQPFFALTKPDWGLCERCTDKAFEKLQRQAVQVGRKLHHQRGLWIERMFGPQADNMRRNGMTEKRKKDFHALAAGLATMLEEKRQAYGQNMEIVPKVMELLYPNGVRPEHYPTMLLLVRILDKISRLASGGGRWALGEDAWKDIAGYALCAMYDAPENREDR